MIIVDVDGADLVVRIGTREVLASGAENAYQVQFVFDTDWDGLTKTAVFKCGPDEKDTTVSIILDATNTCEIPWEVLSIPNEELFVGVYGTKGRTVIMPTIWRSLGTVYEGADLGTDKVPTPGVYQQILSKMGDLDDLQTTDKSSLVAAINEARSTGGGGGGGGEGTFDTDESLVWVDGVLSVNRATSVDENNTLPITAAAVHTTVGNIEVLLHTI